LLLLLILLTVFSVFKLGYNEWLIASLAFISVIVGGIKYMIKICVCQPKQAFHPAFAGQVPAFAGQVPAFAGQAAGRSPQPRD